MTCFYLITTFFTCLTFRRGIKMANRNSVPSDFVCPITQDIMHDPVLLVDDVNSYFEKNLYQ